MGWIGTVLRISPNVVLRYGRFLDIKRQCQMSRAWASRRHFSERSPDSPWQGDSLIQNAVPLCRWLEKRKLIQFR